MAKNNKKSENYARDLAANEDLSEFAATGATEVAPEVDPVAVANALFAAYDAAEAALIDATAQAAALVATATEARSDAVKAILDGTGQEAFTRKGKEITIVGRKSKNGGVRYFFKGKKDKPPALEVE